MVIVSIYSVYSLLLLGYTTTINAGTYIAAGILVIIFFVALFTTALYAMCYTLPVLRWLSAFRSTLAQCMHFSLFVHFFFVLMRSDANCLLEIKNRYAESVVLDIAKYGIRVKALNQTNQEPRSGERRGKRQNSRSKAASFDLFSNTHHLCFTFQHFFAHFHIKIQTCQLDFPTCSLLHISEVVWILGNRLHAERRKEEKEGLCLSVIFLNNSKNIFSV